MFHAENKNIPWTQYRFFSHPIHGRNLNAKMFLNHYQTFLIRREYFYLLSKIQHGSQESQYQLPHAKSCIFLNSTVLACIFKSFHFWWIFGFSRKSTLFELFKFKISLSISVGFWLKPKSHLDFQKWIFKTVSKTDIQNRRFFPVLKIAKKLKKPKKYQKSVGFGRSRKMSVLAQKNVDFVPSLDWGNGDIPSA